MSDEEDYLSDKFLTAEHAEKPKTYSQLRKDAQKQSKLKDEQNRQKSRRQLELESREEGLGKSLFTRAKEEQGSSNKALSIMLKMGFKPGQSLGKAEDLDRPSSPSDDSAQATDTATKSSSHRAEPLPLNEWQGRTGIGVRKRARSPSSTDRIAKMAKMAETSAQLDFRDRRRRIYEITSAQGKLVSAQRTCVTLDEKTGKSFNVLWLNPQDPDTFPAGLIDALALHTNLDLSSLQPHPFETEEARLRRQMRSDSLSNVGEEDVIDPERYSDILEEVVHFLRLEAPDRLLLVLSYLRERYYYCFWCGSEYENEEELERQCPGPDEDVHD